MYGFGILSQASQIHLKVVFTSLPPLWFAYIGLSKRQESGWGEVLRKCALSLAAVAAVAAPISFAPQQVKPVGYLANMFILL